MANFFLLILIFFIILVLGKKKVAFALFICITSKVISKEVSEYRNEPTHL